MADCSNTPTPESTANFDLDSRCFSEVMTSNEDYTTAKASDGNVKKTLASALRDAGWEHVGEWSTNPLVESANQVIPYAGTNQLFRPLSLPYQVDSATNPNPNELLPDPATGYAGEIVDVSKFISTENINDYTDIVYKSSGSNSAVENMINGVPLSVKIGGTCSTGGTTWLRTGGDGSSISDYEPQGAVYVSDFKLSTGDSSGLQEILDLSGNIVVPRLTNIIIDDQCNVKSNTRLTVDGSITTTKHGYDALVCDAVSDVEISGNGFISGIGLYPIKTLNGQSGAGEKGYCLAERNKWPLSRGNVDNGLGSFQGGFIGNGGCGVLIKNGCENVEVNIETKGFSYAGVCVGDPLLTGTAGEVRNKNITIDGEHHDNYDAGVSYHAVDGLVIKDSCRTYNNGHPDAVESDNEINPGYGVTSRLTADAAESTKDLYLGGRHTFNKRKNVDAHSGQDIRVDAYSEGAMVYGAAFGGNSGARGRVMGQLISVNDGYATGATVDSKTHLAISGDYDSTSLTLITRGGEGSIPFVINRVVGIDLNVDCDSSGGAVKPAKPFEVIATSPNPASIKLRGSITGPFTSGATLAWCSGEVSGLTMDACVYDSVGQSLIMTDCNIDFGLGNAFPHPQFNTGNGGQMQGATTKITMTYNGTANPSLRYRAGGKFITSATGGGAGFEFAASDNSYFVATDTTYDVQLTMRTPKSGLVDYFALRETSGTGKQRIAVAPYTDANVLLGPAELDGVSVSVLIGWGYQL